MFLDAHYICDKPGCNKTFEGKDFNKMKPGQKWFRLRYMSPEGSHEFDFCSLDCIAEQIRVDPQALEWIIKPCEK